MGGKEMEDKLLFKRLYSYFRNLIRASVLTKGGSFHILQLPPSLTP